MAIVQVDELISAGVHYGHRSSRWNPKMRPYIYGKRNLIHIIDLRETVRGLIRAHKFLQRIASQGSLVLFVATKRQAQEAVQKSAHRCFMPYVRERWIGGTFTNFRTIRHRLQRLEELESLVRTGEINKYSKKRRSSLMREMRKIHRNLSGIRTMNRMPGAMVVIDSHRESSAVREARKVGVPTLALIDTDSDPDKIDLAIPGNDDSIRAIDLVLNKLADAVLSGLHSLPKDQVEKLEREFTKAHAEVIPLSDAPAPVVTPGAAPIEVAATPAPEAQPAAPAQAAPAEAPATTPEPAPAEAVATTPAPEAPAEPEASSPEPEAPATPEAEEKPSE
ncbi:30S ribosomal protein S2 [Planctomycetes bacterium Pan216]|uniref:Small ribosomal subunit protein uS2 n=1 Tax=Kolteria novifilia TaxID=2527975 RepID=A0A518B064_9BACT|nr:30S ribosomal protein S2 [Planctomycetes bacterium Pan216]